MGNTGADGFYKLTFSFPDSAVGKTLFYRYQTAAKRDILRPVVLENKSLQLVEDKRGYIDGVQGKVKPAPQCPSALGLANGWSSFSD